MKTLADIRAARARLCGPAVLDGQPAEVRAPLQTEATVQKLDPAGPSIRVPWYIVEMVRRKGGEFHAPAWMKEAA